MSYMSNRCIFIVNDYNSDWQLTQVFPKALHLLLHSHTVTLMTLVFMLVSTNKCIPSEIHKINSSKTQAYDIYMGNGGLHTTDFIELMGLTFQYRLK